MKYDPARDHRRSVRLQGYDYAQAGAYFVTLVTHGRECFLGEVRDGEVLLNDRGRIVIDAWKWLATQYPHVELDAWIVMPNHLHGIIVIKDAPGRGGSRTAQTASTGRKPLGRLIGAFKTVSTKRLNDLRATPGAPVWQRNYYEHVIRTEAALDRIRHYIVENPLQWSNDAENPARVLT